MKFTKEEVLHKIQIGIECFGWGKYVRPLPVKISNSVGRFFLSCEGFEETLSFSEDGIKAECMLTEFEIFELDQVRYFTQQYLSCLQGVRFAREDCVQTMRDLVE